MSHQFLHLISGPRNISTALMYSFAQRKDTQVIDEPFYGYYLTLSGADHPGREEVLATQPHTAEGVFRNLQSVTADKPLIFIKNMAHHLEGIPFDFMKNIVNILLIRDPGQILASYNEVRKNPTVADIGLKQQLEIYNYLSGNGHPPVIIDSNEVLGNPKKALMKLCSSLSVPFESSMLSWPAGPRPEDGIWAKYWYSNVHRSTGFEKQPTSTRHLPDHLIDVYTEALSYYTELHKNALKF